MKQTKEISHVETEVIHADKTAKWLDDIDFFKLNGLPDGILDKGSTGCGMTTLALGKMTDGTYTDTSGKYVVALPLNAAIDNKVEQYNTDQQRLFVVRYGTKKTDFDKFITSGGKKILVTYDSLHKLGKWMPTVYEEFKLLVDEYQDFLRFYGLKKQAYKVAVSEISKYKHKTLGSATPIPARYSPDAFTGMKAYEVIWPDARPINIISQHVGCPTTLAVKIIREYMLKGEFYAQGIRSRSLNVFVNSIASIETIINETELTPEQCRIICGSDPANEKHLGMFFGLRGKDVKDPYLVTFITSAGYNSIDLYGEDTLSISLSYGKKEHTLQSTFIDLPQIAGRMRNEKNMFYRTLFHFYTTVPYELSGEYMLKNPRPFLGPKPAGGQELIEWYKQLQKLNAWKFYAKEEMDLRFSYKLDAEIADNQAQIDLQNRGTDRTKAWTKQLIDSGNEAVNYFCYEEVNGHVTFSLDNDYVKFLKFQMEELKLSYIDGKSLRRGYEEAGMNGKEYLDYQSFGEEIISKSKENFTTALKRYLNDDLSESEKQDIVQAYPDIQVFTEAIKAERIRSLDYSRKALKEEMDRISDRGTSIVQLGLSKRLENGKFYTLKQVKDALQVVFDNTLGFKDQKAKATDIMTYVPRAVFGKPRINGKQEKGYTIIYDFALKYIKV